MIFIDLIGGLGNQLFQIFTVIAYSLEHKIAFRFPSNKTGCTHTLQGVIYKRPLYFDTFLKNLLPFTATIFNSHITYREKGHFYTKIPFCQKNMLLTGYFQSYKYFDKYKFDILKLIGYNSYKLKLDDGYNNTISIHFRIGDYKHKPKYHPILPVEYYQKSLNHILLKTNCDKFNVIYYCEKKDTEQVNNNINVLKTLFPNLIFKKSPEILEDWEEVISMSCCTHNIIANSTFSWWGAYLNENKDKIICYPSKWFGDVANINVCDLCPETWEKINV